MGLLGDWFKAKHMKDPVRGEAYVVSSSMPDPSASTENYTMTVVVRGEGIEPTTVVHSGMASTSKWPYPGTTLPVTVDRADPTRLHVEWDDVATAHDQGIAEANRIAAMMRGQALAGTSTSTTSLSVNGQVVDASQFPGLREEIMGIVAGSIGNPEAARAQIQQAFQGRGLPVAGAVVPAAGVAAPEPELEPAERLRRLQDLKSQGLIDETEYEAQRQRILREI